MSSQQSQPGALEIIHRIPDGAGSAPRTPLLFVHGLGHGAWCWDAHFLPYFASHGYPSSALSVRGHGGSPGDLRGASVAQYVDDVLAVLEDFPKPPVLIGHSLGGMLVQKVLEIRQDIPAAVLIGSVPPTNHFSWVISGSLQKPGPMLKALATGQITRMYASPEMARWAFFRPDTPESVVCDCVDRLVAEPVRVYFDMLLARPIRLERVTAPVLALGAEKDFIASNEVVRRTAAWYRNAPCRIIPGVGHDMMLEPGWQSAADAILGWLSERGL